MKEYRTVDKGEWGHGPWDDEPDKVSWNDDVTGLACLAVRNRLGAWCGYVGVPPSHPAHGFDYDEVDADVHGGLTYSDSCQDGPEETAVCHVPAAGEPEDVWWFGFDCAHAFDVVPAMEARERSLGMEPIRFGGEEYRDLDYVREQVAELAKQLA